MSQAEALLNSLSETTINHNHPVPDSDTYFIIDPYTRQIENTNYNKTVLMRGDHNSERFTFELPRYVDGHDMSLCNRVIVHFDNVGATIMDVYSDVAYTDDLRLNPDNPETVICSWLIRREATQIVGILSFSLQYQCVEGDEIAYEWNTDSYDDIEIRKSKNNGESAVIQYTNVLEQWRSQIFGAGDSVMANITAEGQTQVASVTEVSATEQAAIELKGSETLATIPDDYTEVYNMASEAVRTKADGIVCEAEGEVINVSDSSDDYVRGLNLYGKSTQLTTTGKQLANNTNSTYKTGGITFTSNPDGSVSITGTAVADAYYLFDFCNDIPVKETELIASISGSDGVSMVIGYFTDQENFVNDIATVNSTVTKTFMYPAEAVATRSFLAVTTGKSINATVYPLIRLATIEDDTYEPFSGGIPAPNPEYPQDIVSIVNPEVVVLGKNLLRDSKIQKKTVYNGLTCEYEGDGVFHIYGTFNGTNQGMQFSTSYLNIPVNRTDSFTMSAQLVEGTLPDDFHPYLGLKSETVEVQNWFSLQMTSDMKVGDVVSAMSKPGWILAEPTHIARFWIYSHNDDLDSYTADFRIRIWVERNEVNTGYQASSEGALNISHTLLGIPVTSGGNYTDNDGQQWICDEVDLERGVYIKRIFNKTFTDFSGALNYSYDGKGTSCALAIGEQLIATMGMCTHLPLTANATGDYRFNPIDGVIYFKLEGELTFDELKAKLTEMSPTVIAILANPIETSLVAEEIETYKSLRTNYPNTTILNDVGAMMKVKYNADTKLYISNDAYLQGNPPSSDSDPVSPIVGIEEIDGGHTITITDVNGAQSFDVLDGKDGHTPLKGVDYFTDEEKQEIAEQAASLIEVPDGGSTPLELIVDVTTEEDVSSIEIDRDINGKEFVLAGLEFKCTFPVSSARDDVVFNTAYSSAGGVTIGPCLTTTVAITAYGRVYGTEQSILDGATTGFIEVCNTVGYTNRGTAHCRATKFYVCPKTTTNVLPAGTRVQIWGVRV